MSIGTGEISTPVLPLPVAISQRRRYHTGMRWAALVREYMDLRGYRPARLAREAGVDKSAISRILQGKQKGHGETVARITAVLGIPADEVQRALQEMAPPVRPRDVTSIHARLSRLSPKRRAEAEQIIEAVIAGEEARERQETEESGEGRGES